MNAGLGHALTYRESIWLWQNGGGQSIYVDGREILTIDVGMGRFAVPLENTRVHGHVTTNPDSGRIYDAMYDFDHKPNPNYNPQIGARNILNSIGAWQNGSGTPFEINYRYDDAYFQ